VMQIELGVSPLTGRVPDGAGTSIVNIRSKVPRRRTPGSGGSTGRRRRRDPAHQPRSRAAGATGRVLCPSGPRLHPVAVGVVLRPWGRSATPARMTTVTVASIASPPRPRRASAAPSEGSADR
jgi:hypothetical protein